MLEYGLALSYHLESYKLASKEKDPKYKALVLLNIGSIYIKQQKFKEAEENFRQIYDIYKETKNYKNLGTVCSNLGMILNYTNRLDEAKRYLDEALIYCKGKPHENNVNLELVENELLRGNTTEARIKAEKIYETVKNDRKYVNPASYLLVVAKAYLKEQNFEKVIVTCEKILKNRPDLEDKQITFELLTEAYYKTNSYKKAFIYKDSVQKVENKLAALKNNKLYENNIVKLEIQNYKNEISFKDQKLKTERKLYYSIIVAILAIVITIILVLRQKKLTVERNNLILEKQIREKDQEQEQLQKEIELRNRKLSAKALYLSDRNQLIDGLLLSIANIPELSNEPFLNSQIKTLKDYLRADNEWDNFISHFEEVNPGFLSRLKNLHPTLTANDMRYIAYVYMNLTAKEISSLLNITIHASKKRKERIAAKMNLPEDVSLYSYISGV
jgi:tetratricopeptide (TPR) repeat protein